MANPEEHLRMSEKYYKRAKSDFKTAETLEELEDKVKTLLNDIDASDRRLEEWRASRKATSVGSREQVSFWVLGIP